MGTERGLTLTVVLPFTTRDGQTAIVSRRHFNNTLSNTRARWMRHAAFATKRGRCGRRVGVPVGSDTAMQ
jgi:hypothetical protein